MSPHLGFFGTTFFRTIIWQRLIAEIFPVLKPTAATANIIACAINIDYSHNFALVN